jgi:serine/threonine-protein phosphatase 5
MAELVKESTELVNVENSEPTPESIARANALKDEGNVLLSHGKYSQAADKYTAAIAIYPNAIFFSNRAQALIKLENYGLAIQDANDALK